MLPVHPPLHVCHCSGSSHCLDMFPEAVLGPLPNATIQASLRGPSEDDWSCAGQRMVCKLLQCSCIFVPVHGWPFLKCGVAASQVRAVNSPFTRGKSSLTLVLACFRTGSVFRELMVCLQRVNLLSVESGLGYLCVQFITT